MTTIIIVLLIYLLIGIGTFELAVKLLGGMDAYMEIIKENNPKYYRSVFELSRLIVIIFWPYWHLKTLIKTFSSKGE